MRGQPRNIQRDPGSIKRKCFTCISYTQYINAIYELVLQSNASSKTFDKLNIKHKDKERLQK
jgi:hypothetical protein